MSRARKPGRYAAPEPRSYSAGAAIPLPVVPALPERLAAAVERAGALLRREGLPTVATVDLPGGGWRSLSRHILLLGHPRDGDVHLAARLIEAADDAAAGGARAAHGLLELGEINALSRVYMTDSRANAERRRKPEGARNCWNVLGERVTRWRDISEDETLPTDFDFTDADGNDFECSAWRELTDSCERVKCEIRGETGSQIKTLAQSSFEKRYLTRK